MGTGSAAAAPRLSARDKGDGVHFDPPKHSSLQVSRNIYIGESLASFQSLPPTCGCRSSDRCVVCQRVRGSANESRAGWSRSMLASTRKRAWPSAQHPGIVSKNKTRTKLFHPPDIHVLLGHIPICRNSKEGNNLVQASRRTVTGEDWAPLSKSRLFPVGIRMKCTAL